MNSNRETLLCQYRYDPLDRLIDCTPSMQPHLQRFYLKDRLVTEVQGALQRSIMQYEDQLLAQQQRQNGIGQTTLLATDQQRSVLNELDVPPPRSLTYAPYGHRSREDGLLSLLGFNGERPDPVTGCYLLGNGYRAFNPVLMRFNSPDSWSPFGEGGLNAYAYCVGDPINRIDKTGHASGFFAWLMKSLKRTPSDAYTPLQRNSTSSSVSLSTLAGTAGTSMPDTGVSSVLLEMTSTKVIKSMTDPIVRNQAKLSNVKKELINLKNNPDLVINEKMSQNYETVKNLMTPNQYENIVRKAIPKEIIELENKQSHYVKKIHGLQEKSSRVRQQPTSNH